LVFTQKISGIPSIILFSIYYYGLGWKKSWIAPLEIVASVFGFVMSLLFTILIIASVSISAIKFQGSSLISAIFFLGIGINGFLFYFFTRKEVKEYFDYTLTKKSIFFAFLFILGVWGFSWFLSLQQIL